MPSGPIGDVDKIADKSVVEDPVIEVSANSGGEQREYYVHDSSLAAAVEGEVEDYGDEHDNGYGYELEPSSSADSEDCAVIEDHYERKEAVDNRVAEVGPVAEPVENRLFAPQVERYSRDGDRPEEDVRNQRRRGNRRFE